MLRSLRHLMDWQLPAYFGLLALALGGGLGLLIRFKHAFSQFSWITPEIYGARVAEHGSATVLVFALVAPLALFTRSPDNSALKSSNA